MPAAADLLFTAGANGSRVDRVDVLGSAAEGGAAAARVVRLWCYDGALDPRLFKEVELAAVTPSGTVKGGAATVYFINGLVLPTGWTLRATLSVAGANDAVSLTAHGGDY